MPSPSDRKRKPQAAQQNPTAEKNPTAGKNKEHAGAGAKKNAELLVCLGEFRLAQNPPLTWDQLSKLCGVSRPTLLKATRRGTISDRKAAVIRASLIEAGAGDLLKVQADVA